MLTAVKLTYLLASLIPIGDRHIEVQDNHIKHLCLVPKTNIMPLLGYFLYILLLVHEGLRGMVKCFEPVPAADHIEVTHL